MFIVFCFKVIINLKPYVLSLLYNTLCEKSCIWGSVDIVTILAISNALNLKVLRSQCVS